MTGRQTDGHTKTVNTVLVLFPFDLKIDPLVTGNNGQHCRLDQFGVFSFRVSELWEGMEHRDNGRSVVRTCSAASCRSSSMCQRQQLSITVNNVQPVLYVFHVIRISVTKYEIALLFISFRSKIQYAFQSTQFVLHV